MRYVWTIALITVFIVVAVFAYYLNRDEGETIEWVSLADGQEFDGPVNVEVDPPDGTTEVQFSVNGSQLRSVANSPWALTLELPDGTHEIQARATNENGATLAEGSVTINVSLPTDGVVAEDDEPTSAAAEPAVAPTSEPTPEAREPTPAPTMEPPNGPPDGTWVATGLVLNTEYGESGFSDHWFYISRDDGETWQPTYQEMAENDAYHGLLMNFRSSRALFSDEEVDEVIAHLDDYRAHGILMLTAALQGGDGVNGFEPDGTLKPAYADRLVKLAEAMSERGMVLTVYLFFQGTDEDLRNAPAVRRGVTQVAELVLSNDLRNVIIEIANEHNHGGFDHSIIKDDSNGDSGNVAELVMVAKEAFDDSSWRALVTASKRGNARWSNGKLREVADVAMIHGNNTDPETQAQRAASVRDSVPYPVVMNEDNYLSPYDTGMPTEKTLEQEKEAAVSLVASGVSWGMMMAPWNQEPDYDWHLGPEPGLNGDDRDVFANYVHDVFDHIQAEAGIGDGSAFEQP